MSPIVSICIPTFNRQDYILDSVRSSLKQTYQNLEVIVYDNHSTDNTIQILKKIQDPRLKVYSQKRNVGMVNNWNSCLKVATGKYIKILASDDILKNNCIEKEVDFLIKNKKVILVTCKRQFIDNENNVTKEVGLSNKTEVLNGIKYASLTLKDLRVNGIGEPTAVLIRFNNATKKIKFDKRFFQLSDLEYWLRILPLGDIGYIDESLCQFRVHKNSISAFSQSNGGFIKETVDLIRKYYNNSKFCKTYSLSKSDMRNVYIRRTKDFISTVKKLIFQKQLWQATVYSSKLIANIPFKYLFQSLFLLHE